MKEWPADNKAADFEDLVDPVCDAIRKAYDIKRINAGQTIPYHGLEVGRSTLATCFGATERLSAEQLRYSEEEQGRDALTEIVSVAVQLGIEQGRRIEHDKLRMNDLLVRVLTETVAGYKEKFGDLRE